MINKTICLSIIIPCYNVENYIKDCLDSLISQSYVSKEVICIDDGSTDNTISILEKYASCYEFIKIYKQTNQGVSAARNKGIELATGEYILFIDSDDILNPDLLKYFELSLKTNPQLELFYFDYSAFTDKNILKLQHITGIETKTFESGISLLNYLLEKKNYSGVVWRYIFKRQLVTEKFIERNHEDHLFSLSIITKAKISHYLKNKMAYFHRIGHCSLSNLGVDNLYTNTLRSVLHKCIQKITTLPLSAIATRNYILVMNATYLETILKSEKFFNKDEKDNLIKELGLLKLLIRIYINNKSNIIGNICFISKFLKQHHCSISTKIALLKCAISKQHPCSDIKNNYKQYCSLDKF
ncbi:glycosyltransferase [Gilliamella sp. B2824]|uniref:glycosyltransferase n=1 Tax=Gilliamella sp. B2824 TaxID=2818019 RepID=UPI002269ABD7|nr:glycosyltransferase family 2 protein [Gilliamella sp. B2824]MCX8738336.1 glycosyltransferase [Gilliamella sp. B2824]